MSLMSDPYTPQKQRLLACLCHIAGALTAKFFPANAFITLSLARALKQDHFVKLHAEQAADFNLSFTVYVLGGLLAYALLALGANDIAQVLNLGLSSAEIEALTKKIAQGGLGFAAATYLILVAIASIRALLGREHRYPFSLGWYQRMEKALEGKNASNP